MMAAVEAWRAGLFTRPHWARNVVSGVIVGVVALPLAMAFAIASGARPEQGLYTAILAGVIVSVAGGSRLQIAGPTGAFVAILSGITARFGIDGLQVATLMAGVMLLAMGLARLGVVIRFIPSPVIMGFTAGIGVVIFVGQWRDFLGLPPGSAGALDAHFHTKVLHLLQALPKLHGPTLALGALALAIVLGAPRVPKLKRIPAPLLALVAVTALQAALALPGVATIGSAFGGLPRQWPGFVVPDITLTQALLLLGPAFTIAMLGAIESLLSAVVADGMAGTRHDANQELIGQGLANIVAPMFGGFAATGALARTATNVKSGGTSPLSGIVHAATLLVILMVLAPLAARIPLAVLSAILFVVAWNMSELPRVATMLHRAPPADRLILAITFLLTVFADLVVAVNVGVTLSILHFLKRMSETTRTERVDNTAFRDDLAARGLAPQAPPGTVVYEIAGPMFFGAVENFERTMREIGGDPSTIVLRLRMVPFIDLTGIESLAEAVERFGRRGVRIVLVEVNPRVLHKLRRAGVLEGVHAPTLYPTLQDAWRALEQAAPSAATA